MSVVPNDISMATFWRKSIIFSHNYMSLASKHTILPYPDTKLDALFLYYLMPIESQEEKQAGLFGDYSLGNRKEWETEKALGKKKTKKNGRDGNCFCKSDTGKEKRWEQLLSLFVRDLETLQPQTWLWLATQVQS